MPPRGCGPAAARTWSLQEAGGGGLVVLVTAMHGSKQQQWPPHVERRPPGGQCCAHQARGPPATGWPTSRHCQPGGHVAASASRRPGERSSSTGALHGPPTGVAVDHPRAPLRAPLHQPYGVLQRLAPRLRRGGRPAAAGPAARLVAAARAGVGWAGSLGWWPPPRLQAAVEAAAAGLGGWARACSPPRPPARCCPPARPWACGRRSRRWCSRRSRWRSS
jgi:hypothetical protein